MQIHIHYSYKTYAKLELCGIIDTKFTLKKYITNKSI